MSEARVLPRWALALVLVAVLVLLLVLGRRDGESGGSGGEQRSAAGEPAAVAPGDDEFCARYRDLAAAQGAFLAQGDASGETLLRTAARDLVATGVPDSMSPLVRTGYRVEIAGVYASLGDELGADAVPGALADAGDESSLSGAVGAFGAWLAEYCPA